MTWQVLHRGAVLVVLATVAVLSTSSAPVGAALSSDSTPTPPPTGAAGLPLVYQGTKPVEIVVRPRTDYPGKLSSTLYIPLTVTLLDPQTHQPVPDAYTVVAIASSASQPGRDNFEFAYPYNGGSPGAAPGVYFGVVIVPAGGHYTIVVNAFNPSNASTSKLPTSLGNGKLELDAVGAPLVSATATAKSRKASLLELAILGLHGAVGLVWFALAWIVAILGWRSRRRYFATGLNDLLDRKVHYFVRSLYWATAAVWITGFINLKKAVAYPPPLSSAQVTRLFRLPYAKPYTLALYTKIGMFLVMTILLIPLVVLARKRAAEVPDVVTGTVLEDERRSVGANGAQRWAHLRERDRPRNRRRTGSVLLGRVAVGALALSGPVILGCVTILKFVHILSEQRKLVR